jgi:hypothetical protein
MLLRAAYYQTERGREREKTSAQRRDLFDQAAGTGRPAFVM